jgi:hypothetical protein
MSDAELVTWQLGAERARLYGGIVGFLSMGRRMQDRLMTGEQLEAKVALGHDSWAYWVRRGWDDGRGVR